MLVTVKKASDLPAADGNGLSDPYVRLTLDERKQKTGVQRRTLSPTWNEKKEWMHVRAPPPALAYVTASCACRRLLVCGSADLSRSGCPPSTKHDHASIDQEKALPCMWVLQLHFFLCATFTTSCQHDAGTLLP